MRSRTRSGLAAAIVAGGLVVASCGGDDNGGGGNGGTPADVVAHGDDALQFDQSTYTARAGTITIELVNDGVQPHTLLFDDSSIDFRKLSVARGGTDRGTVDLQPGTYTFYCDVVGHRAAGMEATLVVN